MLALLMRARLQNQHRICAFQLVSAGEGEEESSLLRESCASNTACGARISKVRRRRCGAALIKLPPPAMRDKKSVEAAIK